MSTNDFSASSRKDREEQDNSSLIQHPHYNLRRNKPRLDSSTTESSSGQLVYASDVRARRRDRPVPSIKQGKRQNEANERSWVPGWTRNLANAHHVEHLVTLDEDQRERYLLDLVAEIEGNNSPVSVPAQDPIPPIPKPSLVQEPLFPSEKPEKDQDILCICGRRFWVKPHPYDDTLEEHQAECVVCDSVIRQHEMRCAALEQATTAATSSYTDLTTEIGVMRSIPPWLLDALGWYPGFFSDMTPIGSMEYPQLPLPIQGNLQEPMDTDPAVSLMPSSHQADATSLEFGSSADLNGVSGTGNTHDTSSRAGTSGKASLEGIVHDQPLIDTINPMYTMLDFSILSRRFAGDDVVHPSQLPGWCEINAGELWAPPCSTIGSGSCLISKSCYAYDAPDYSAPRHELPETAGYPIMFRKTVYVPSSVPCGLSVEDTLALTHPLVDDLDEKWATIARKSNEMLAGMMWDGSNTTPSANGENGENMRIPVQRKLSEVLVEKRMRDADEEYEIYEEGKRRKVQ